MKNLIVILSIIFTFSSCNSPESKDETTPEAEMEEPVTKSEDTTKNVHVISDEDIETFKNVSASVADQVIDAYMKIKDALVNTNGEEAKQIAASVQEDIKAEEGEAIKMIKEDIEHIASTSSLQHQREHFKTLSSHVYALVKANDANNEKLYKQYCPMAFNNTGAYWLSSSEEIRNPYFGDKMLKCGKVQETLQ